MKNRLSTLVIAVMMLFVPLCLRNNALSTSLGPLGNLSPEASQPSRLRGDTVIQFPDPNFEAVVREKIGKPTGDITTSVVSVITSLTLDSRNITDLKGIEYFIALENLDCNKNQLTTLDMSNNAALKWLGCWGNQLTSLNVGGATALEGLECSNNDLATLDVGLNTALEMISCGDNQLTSLNVGGAIALKNLNCSDNRLTTLDVSHNTELTDLYCNGNRLATLDMRHNPELIRLYCEDNQLTVLDVSRNPALTDLYCYNNLFPDQSAIIGLDEKRLDSFVFDPQNGSSTLGVEASLLSGLRGDTTIRLPDPNFEAEVRRIIGKPKGGITANDVAGITSLRVDRLNIADLTGIECFTALKELNCKRNQLTKLDLSQNTMLTDLHCEWNELTTLNVSENAALEELNCHDNQLTMLDVSNNVALVVFDCHNNLFPDESAIIGLDEDKLYYYVFDLYDW